MRLLLLLGVSLSASLALVGAMGGGGGNPCASKDCGHGTCTASTGECECNSGWSGTSCGRCTAPCPKLPDIDPHAEWSSGSCSEVSRCVGGSCTAVCSAGYDSSGRHDLHVHTCSGSGAWSVQAMVCQGTGVPSRSLAVRARARPVCVCGRGGGVAVSLPRAHLRPSLIGRHSVPISRSGTRDSLGRRGYLPRRTRHLFVQWWVLHGWGGHGVLRDRRDLCGAKVHTMCCRATVQRWFCPVLDRERSALRDTQRLQ
jgi:hypothetical protein